MRFYFDIDIDDAELAYAQDLLKQFYNHSIDLSEFLKFGPIIRNTIIANMDKISKSIIQSLASNVEQEVRGERGA